MKREGVIEQRQMHRFGVGRFDLDPPPLGAAGDPDLLRLVRQTDVLRGRLDATADGAVVERGGELGLRLHLVDQAVVPEKHFADVDAVVQHGDEHEQREQTAERAGATGGAGGARGAAHHCDWAPSTRSFTSLSSAILRPSASCGGWYSPTSVRPCFCHSVLPWRWSRISTSMVICT